MFVPVKLEDFWSIWGDANGPSDAFFYSDAYKTWPKPYKCETNKKWVLVWRIIPLDEAIQASRDYYHLLPRLMQLDSTCIVLDPRNMRVYERNGKYPPIRIWVPEVVPRLVLNIIADRTDPYHETAFSVWEKYPHLAKDVYEVVINRLQTFVWNNLISQRSTQIGKTQVVDTQLKIHRKDFYRRAGIDHPFIVDVQDKLQNSVRVRDTYHYPSGFQDDPSLPYHGELLPPMDVMIKQIRSEAESIMLHPHQEVVVRSIEEMKPAMVACGKPNLSIVKILEENQRKPTVLHVHATNGALKDISQNSGRTPQYPQGIQDPIDEPELKAALVNTQFSLLKK